MSIKKLTFLLLVLCSCVLMSLIGVMASHAENLFVDGLLRVEGYSWPATGKGLEFAYNPSVNRGYIQVYDRDNRSWGNLYLGKGQVGVGETSYRHGQFYSITDTETYAILGKSTSDLTDSLRCVGVYGSGATGVWGHGTRIGGYFWSEKNGIVAMGGPNDYAGKFLGKIMAYSLELTGGSDLSENFEIQRMKENLLPSPGMVVSIDPENPGGLTVSKNAYDRKVAGIISGAGGINPAMLMGQKDSKADGAFPVALTGRVYCYVDASYGCIEPGDLLTTSETPGYAMKVADYTKAQGAILGKAITELKEGKGLVLTLVTLQ